MTSLSPVAEEMIVSEGRKVVTRGTDSMGGKMETIKKEGLVSTGGK